MNDPLPDTPTDRCIDTTPAATPCCKCTAYREIIADQQARIAMLTKEMAEARTFAGYIIRHADAAIGKETK